jgi:translation initiation factor IF-2
LLRDNVVIHVGSLGQLKRFKDDVKEVVSGYDCGLNIAGYNDIQEGDIIEGFEEVAVKKTL